MAKEVPIINILTYQLPFELSNQIYNEYQSRLKEADFLIDTYKTYSTLREHKKAVVLFLSLSIFHKRVITTFDGAVKFYGTVTKKSEADTIRIGNYNLTNDEKNKILSVVLSYNQLLAKFSIRPVIMEYYETREFLKKLINFKSELDADFEKRQSKRKGNQEDEDDIPF